MEKSNPLKKTQGLTHLFTHNLNFIYSLILRETERERETVARFILFTLNLNFIYSLLFRERETAQR